MVETFGLPKWCVAFMALCLAFGIGYWSGETRVYDDNARTNMVRCEEDMPCWNCHTMGNHICGKLK